MLKPYDINFSARTACLADTMFAERWSPRAFNKETMPQQDLDKIVDAARYSPSAWNAQPWRILTSRNSEDPDFDRFLNLLAPANQMWAKNASVLGFVVAANHLDSGEVNRWACYDCGFAWAALTFQAANLGYYAHGMAGIELEKIYRQFAIPEDKYTVIAGFAIGKLAHPSELPEAFQKREFPQGRKALKEIYFPGGRGLAGSKSPRH